MRLLLVLVLLVALLAACSSQPEGTVPVFGDSPGLSVFIVPVNGRQITCIYAQSGSGSGSAGGLSCDWEGR